MFGHYAIALIQVECCMASDFNSVADKGVLKSEVKCILEANVVGGDQVVKAL